MLDLFKESAHQVDQLHADFWLLIELFKLSIVHDGFDDIKALQNMLKMDLSSLSLIRLGKTL